MRYLSTLTVLLCLGPLVAQPSTEPLLREYVDTLCVRFQALPPVNMEGFWVDDIFVEAEQITGELDSDFLDRFVARYGVTPNQLDETTDEKRIISIILDLFATCPVVASRYRDQLVVNKDLQALIADAEWEALIDRLAIEELPNIVRDSTDLLRSALQSGLERQGLSDTFDRLVATYNLDDELDFLVADLGRRRPELLVRLFTEGYQMSQFVQVVREEVEFAPRTLDALCTALQPISEVEVGLDSGDIVARMIIEEEYDQYRKYHRPGISRGVFIHLLGNALLIRGLSGCPEYRRKMLPYLLEKFAAIWTDPAERDTELERLAVQCCVCAQTATDPVELNECLGPIVEAHSAALYASLTEEERFLGEMQLTMALMELRTYAQLACTSLAKVSGE